MLHKLGVASDPGMVDEYDRSMPFHYDVVNDQALREFEEEGQAFKYSAGLVDEAEEDADMGFSAIL
ncbi:hypothetical protein AN958_09413 [Leucoagaricus sp. SymC.cos]|nr:hypothetical protein AN958_09413 [Leucoagaricus sp. SymC.cos]